MPRLPPLEPGQRVIFFLCPPDLDERMFGGAPARGRAGFRRRIFDAWHRHLPTARRLHPCWLAWLLLVLRRPGRLAEALALVARRQLEQRLEIARFGIDPVVTIA